MTVGENIRRIRKEKGLTQKALGKLCNINESQIRRYELGLNNSKPKLETIQKIAHALGVEYTDLFSSEKYKITPELLLNRPDIKNYITESVILFMGDNLDSRVKKVLTEGTLEDVADVLNSIIIDIEINEELKMMQIHYYVMSKNDALLNAFEKLNEVGKDEAVKRVQELTEVPKFQKHN